MRSSVEMQLEHFLREEWGAGQEYEQRMPASFLALLEEMKHLPLVFEPAEAGAGGRTPAVNDECDAAKQIRSGSPAMKTKFLFVCTGNKDRSPTAETLCRRYANLEVRSAGTSPYARTPLTEDMVRAADVLVVMERGHAEHIREQYPEAAEGKPLHCLDIPDEYFCMDPALVQALKEKLKPVLEEYGVEMR